MAFKICSVGCGAHAVAVHGPSLQKYVRLNPGATLAACCDLNEQAARSYKERFGFARFYTDLKTMILKERPDAICLVVPTAITAELALVVMEAGIPLLMEKPPGQTREETLRLIETAEKKNLPHRVALNRRFAPLARILQQELAKERPQSPVQCIHYDMFRVNRRDSDFSTTAIHGIDALRFLAGADFREAEFRYQELPQLGAGVANIHFDCVFTNGMVARLQANPVSGIHSEQATLHLYDKSYVLQYPVGEAANTGGKLIRLEQGRTVGSTDGVAAGDGTEWFETFGFYYENASFFDDLRAGRKPTGDLQAALQSVEVAECIRFRKTRYRSDR